MQDKVVVVVGGGSRRDGTQTSRRWINFALSAPNWFWVNAVTVPKPASDRGR